MDVILTLVVMSLDLPYDQANQLEPYEYRNWHKQIQTNAYWPWDQNQSNSAHAHQEYVNEIPADALVPI